MTRTAPSNIDSHIGYKLKVLRLKLGKSLHEIGGILGVSFQQMQKYEKGQNRLSSSNLFVLSKHLRTDIDYFFDGLEEGEDGKRSGALEDTDGNFSYDSFLSLSDHELLGLVRGYSGIQSTFVRKRILDLVKSLSGADQELEIA